MIKLIILLFLPIILFLYSHNSSLFFFSFYLLFSSSYPLFYPLSAFLYQEKAKSWAIKGVPPFNCQIKIFCMLCYRATTLLIFWKWLHSLSFVINSYIIINFQSSSSSGWIIYYAFYQGLQVITCTLNLSEQFKLP